MMSKSIINLICKADDVTRILNSVGIDGDNITLDLLTCVKDIQFADDFINLVSEVEAGFDNVKLKNDLISSGIFK